MPPTRADLVLTLAAVSVASCITAVAGFGLPELLFFAVMLLSLALLLRAGWHAWSREREARREASEMGMMRPDLVAADAVRDERRRLSEDIAAELRAMLVQVRQEAGSPDPPGVVARRIHRHARLASSELRRLLGLLRTSDGPREPASPTPQPPATWLLRRDVIVAGAAGTLALVESIAYPRVEGHELSWWSAALTVTTAVSVVGRSRSPASASIGATIAVALAGILAGGVVGGFWMLITVTGLAWGTIGAPGASVGRTCAGLIFGSAVVGSAWASDQENAIVTTLVVGVLLAVAAVVRRARTRAGQSARLTADLRSSLAETAAAPVEADRVAFAREIHDSVSHAVGLIAMQAGAAEVSATRDPEAARRSLGLIEAAALDALADLDRMHPDAGPLPRTTYDVTALVDRIRAAGTCVTAAGLDDLPAEEADVVYRIVQEALTNVVRHGGGAPARVTIDVDPAAVRVRVVDMGPGPRAAAERGFGLVGLAERVRHAGGRLRTGGGDGGRGFVVEAVLPAGGSDNP